MAEVMKYDDFKDEGSENAVKVRNDFFFTCKFYNFSTHLRMRTADNSFL